MNGSLSQTKFSGNSQIMLAGLQAGEVKKKGWITVKAKHWQLAS